MTGLALVAMNPGGDEDVYEEKAFGFWIYLMSDAIIFALLFATYVVMAPNSASGPTGRRCSACRAPLPRPCCC
jgi:cytochrome o ubiquinol oxidase subunit 3